MKFVLFTCLLCLAFQFAASGQTVSEDQMVDIVYLRDGSKLVGKIIKWDLGIGMEFQLATGATITIPKDDISKVMQDDGDDRDGSRGTFVRAPRPYNFREHGWYQNTSGFFSFAFPGGAGLHHVMGYRFNRLLGVGVGVGVETHDFNFVRNFIPVFAEARGFLLPKKITPYYALKVGYGFGLKDEINGTLDASGGFHFSPEIGVRFGAGDVSYYAGLEYKLQNGSFTWNGWDWSGQTRIKDQISYRRVEFRTGILF